MAYPASGILFGTDITVEFLFLLSFVIGKAHASRVIPLIALVTFDVEQIRIKGLHASAESLPGREGRL
jgi:hypothetical protein